MKSFYGNRLLSEMLIGFYFPIMLLCIPRGVSSQNDIYFKQKIRTVGLNAGISIIDQPLSATTQYDPVLLFSQFRFPIASFQKKYIISTCQELQYNLVYHNDKQGSIRQGHEIGVNAGFELICILENQIWLLFGLGSGPVFSSRPIANLLPKGNHFSNNFRLAISQQLRTFDIPLRLQIEFRFRHSSNAGFKKPNRGIDNFFITMGSLLAF